MPTIFSEKVSKVSCTQKMEKYESNNAVINEVMNNLLLCIIHHDTPAQTMYFKLELKKTKKKYKVSWEVKLFINFHF